MAPVYCLSCKARFPDTARHGRHLGKRKRCEHFYDTLAEATALRNLDAAATAKGHRTHLKQDMPLPEAPPASPAPSHEHYAEEDPERWPSPQDDVAAAHGDSSKRRRVTVEEIEDADAGHGPWVCEDYPGSVAESLGEAVTHFEDLRREQNAQRQSPHAPFADEEEWGLAKWLAKRTTQGGVDEYCKLPIVCISSPYYHVHSHIERRTPIDTQSHPPEFQEQASILQEDR